MTEIRIAPRAPRLDARALPHRVGVIVLSTLLNAAYFLPIIYNAFFKAPPKPDKHHPAHGEAPWPIVLALTATATGTVLLFFFPGVPLTLAKMMMGLN